MHAVHHARGSRLCTCSVCKMRYSEEALYVSKQLRQGGFAVQKSPVLPFISLSSLTSPLREPQLTQEPCAPAHATYEEQIGVLPDVQAHARPGGFEGDVLIHTHALSSQSGRHSAIDWSGLLNFG